MQVQRRRLRHARTTRVATSSYMCARCWHARLTRASDTAVEARERTVESVGFDAQPLGVRGAAVCARPSATIPLMLALDFVWRSDADTGADRRRADDAIVASIAPDTLRDRDWVATQPRRRFLFLDEETSSTRKRGSVASSASSTMQREWWRMTMDAQRWRLDSIAVHPTCMGPPGLVTQSRLHGRSTRPGLWSGLRRRWLRDCTQPARRGG
jgi:hypothetical protein